MKTTITYRQGQFNSFSMGRGTLAGLGASHGRLGPLSRDLWGLAPAARLPVTRWCLHLRVSCPIRSKLLFVFSSFHSSVLFSFKTNVFLFCENDKKLNEVSLFILSCCLCLSRLNSCWQLAVVGINDKFFRVVVQRTGKFSRSITANTSKRDNVFGRISSPPPC